MSFKNKIIYILLYLSVLFFLLWRFDVYTALCFTALYPFFDIFLDALENKKYGKELYAEHNEKLNWLFEENLKSFNLFQKEYQSKLQTFDNKEKSTSVELLLNIKMINLRLEKAYKDLLDITRYSGSESIQKINPLYNGVNGELDVEITLQSEYIRRMVYLITTLKNKNVSGYWEERFVELQKAYKKEIEISEEYKKLLREVLNNKKIK
jgi:hypothetical protein